MITRRQKADHRFGALAHHEAGHAVVAYDFGWHVRQPGVNIGRWPCCYLDYADEALHTTRANICITMAGWLAMEKYYGDGSEAFTGDDIVNHWRALCVGGREVKNPADPRRSHTDLREIAWELYDEDMSDEAIRQAVAYWRDETSLLLNQPRVWAGVTRVASALLRRGHLSPRAVKQILGDSFFDREQDSAAG